ncbi:MAG: GIY-YIG nuclease family protein [Chloroflexi bacterium]|nr:GIY-YIG nuclease family protein [Chloroflexota bacterium]
MAGLSKRLYVGVTNDLNRRVYEHKNHLIEGFTKKYNLTRLVYYEAGGNPRDAIMREKQLKGWLRSRKVALVESLNPEWDDLAEFWFKGNQTPVLERQASL